MATFVPVSRDRPMTSFVPARMGETFEEEFVTRVGRLRAAVDARGSLVRLEFQGPASGTATPANAAGSPCEDVRRQLSEYFEGKRTSFDLPLAPAGTAFQRRVWEELVRIPFGERTSYGELARRLGRPAAFRAVGAANGANPIAIVIPCHRVVGTDGSLTGYGGGLPLKRWLLEYEGRRR